MLPFLSDSNRRRINLGGSTTTATNAALIDLAKTRRQERELQRKQEESALLLQSWFRGRRAAHRAMLALQASFDPDKDMRNALRYLVLFGSKDPLRLHIWSQRVRREPQAIFLPLKGTDRSSWIALMQRISLVLLRDIHKNPRHQASLDHLEVLLYLLDPGSYREHFLERDPDICASLTAYLVEHDFYKVIASAIQSIPIEQKGAECIPRLISLSTRPLVNIPQSSSEGLLCVGLFCTTVLTIPLLPNRLPLSSITKLSANIPFSRFSSLKRSDIEGLGIELKVHFLANVTTFTAPRYQKLAAPVLESYLNLLAIVLNGIPPGTVKSARPSTGLVPNGVDSDEETTPSLALDPPRSLALDNRTIARIRTALTSGHIQPLLAASIQRSVGRQNIFTFVLAATNSWPSHKNEIWDAVSVSCGQGFVREIYRQYVRSSPLGKSECPVPITDSSLSHYWPPFLFVVELYNHLLMTMGDDEFFAPSHQVPRNPLTLDEVSAFSRQLLEITYWLYCQHDHQLNRMISFDGLQISWENIRERCTICLQALHSRDSRRSFTVPGHWHWTHKLDIKSFVDAAIAEENELEPSMQRMSRRQVASVSPRLGILNNIPFSIPFDVRVAIFRSFIANDRRKLGIESEFQSRSRTTRITVRRGKIAQDGFDHLRDADMKRHIQITFIDQFGNEEMGIDGGGVFKEFLTSLTKEVFDTDKGLWLETSQRELYPNPHSYATEPHSLNWYNFIGRILGKAIYEGILVDVTFAGFFLAKWLGKQSYLDDLASLDQELYRGLIHLKHAPDPESFSLDFTITIDDFGVPRTIELIRNGSSIPVTKANLFHYIHLVCLYHLSKKIRLQTEAFFEGLASMVDPKWLRMFNQQEMQLLISGDDSPIDLNDLRMNTQYGGLYDDQHPTIRLFWKVVESFDQQQKRALLGFATSCGRPPLLGFKELRPNFSIRDAGSDTSRLPTASTCVNLLKLPLYQNEAVLRDKILKAIFSGAGFDLS